MVRAIRHAKSIDSLYQNRYGGSPGFPFERPAQTKKNRPRTIKINPCVGKKTPSQNTTSTHTRTLLLPIANIRINGILSLSHSTTFSLRGTDRSRTPPPKIIQT
mmetsp:Transcript_29369/g.61263  ORF Transcript_29369/g.61263 Transcript_29369/m.61263 type:complete len:104 (-) Transcript_29369:59-370(-)